MSEETNSGSANMKAIALAENRVLIVYCSDVNATGTGLHGFICTIQDKTIIVGTDVQLTNKFYYSSVCSITILSKNKIFIAHNDNILNSGGTLYGLVCTISGTEIIAGTDTKISTTVYGTFTVSTIALSASKVFIASDCHPNNYVYGIICNVSEDKITPKTTTKLSTLTANTVKAVLISENKVFVSGIMSGSKSIDNRVCTINDYTITVGSYKLISNNYVPTKIETITLTEDKVLIVYAKNETTRYLYANICTINGTTITVNTTTMLSSGSASNYSISLSKILKNKILVFYSYDTRLQKMVCNIDENTITVEENEQLLDTSYSAANITSTDLLNNKILVAHSLRTKHKLFICISI